MKKIFKQVTFLFIVIIICSSCKKDFLEIQPKGKLIAKTVSDYDLLLNNLNLITVGGVNAQVFMGDEVAAIEPYFSSSEPRVQRLFKWEAKVYERNEDAPETSALLQNIYTYNKIINEVMDASGGTEEEKKSIRAEALGGRAWSYFMLINYFGLPYNEASSETDPGFPIITKAEVTATQFKRASVKEVYEFIVNDLQKATQSLPNGSFSRVRMSGAAAYGLLGKVYIFMGKFDLALAALNTSFERVANANLPVELYDYNATFAPGGEFLPVDIFGPAAPSTIDDKEVLYAKGFSNFWIISSALVISPETVSLFGPADLRLNFYSNTPFPFGDPYPDNLLRRTGPLVAGFGITLPDLILLRAECNARLNNLEDAVSDLEKLRKNRMSLDEAAVPAEVTSDKMALLKYILEERIREFASLGFRWFDMRRLSVDPLFAQENYIHKLYGQDGNIININLDPKRFALKIPPKILDENPGMADNQ